MAILVTGGAGFIGSHACVELLAAGRDVVIVDNLANASADVVDRIAQVAGKRPEFHEVDVRDGPGLARAFASRPIECVIHFAGLKSVAESVEQPHRYYDVNVGGMLSLVRAMEAAGVRRLVFSSSATVYGEPRESPIPETHPLAPLQPYGHTKVIGESILAGLCGADARWSAVSLRYFNPAGAHPGGLLGEAPRGQPNNLMPSVCDVARGVRERLEIYGSDYDTPDGTGLRDYIHVVDLARGHVDAVALAEREAGHRVLNLGSGSGFTVLEVVAAFERASGKPIARTVGARRPGDIARCVADCRRAQAALGWKPARTLDDMCRDAWRWSTRRP